MKRYFVIVTVIICIYLPTSTYALEPANPNANEDVRAFLNWINNFPNKSEKRLLMGQFLGNTGWTAKDKYSSYIDSLHSKYGVSLPLIGTGWGLGGESAITPTLKEYWNNGGLVFLNFAPRNPWTREGIKSSIPSGNSLKDLIDPQKPIYKTWHDDLDQYATSLQTLQKAGVTVMFFPYDEVNQLVFWWAQGTAKDFINLWRETFDYLTRTKGLNNLIWVFGAHYYVADTYGKRGHWHDYYPGNNFVDMVGSSIYDGVSIARQYVSNATGNPCRLWAIYENMTKGKTSWTWTPYDDMTAIPKPFGATGCCGTGEGYDLYNDFLYHVKNTFPKISYGLVWLGAADLMRGENVGPLMADPWFISREDLKPEQPLCSIPANGQTNIFLNPMLKSGPYLGPRAHYSSHWQIALSDDKIFQNPIYDSGKKTDALTNIKPVDANLASGTQYKWRVRHGFKLPNGQIAWGPWSIPAAFLTGDGTVGSLVAPGRLRLNE